METSHITETLGSLLKFLSVSLLASALFLVSCDGDPFGLSKRHIVGGYFLEHFVDGNVYFLRGDGENVQGGVLEGAISDIGWSDEYILCLVDKQYGGDVDGYYAVEIATREIVGPLSQDAISGNNQMNKITLSNSVVTFDSLE